MMALIAMAKTKITPDLLQAALVGFEVEKQRIEAKIAELRAILGSAPVPATRSAKPKRTLSAAARKRIAEAQKQRWAKFRSEAHAAGPTKRVLSAAGRKAIVAATKKRWAEKRAVRSGTDGTGPRETE